MRILILASLIKKIFLINLILMIIIILIGPLIISMMEIKTLINLILHVLPWVTILTTKMVTKKLVKLNSNKAIRATINIHKFNKNHQ